MLDLDSHSSFCCYLIVVFVMLQLVAYRRTLGARGIIFRSFNKEPNSDRIISNWDCDATFRSSIFGDWTHHADSAYGTVSCKCHYPFCFYDSLDQGYLHVLASIFREKLL